MQQNACCSKLQKILEKSLYQAFIKSIKKKQNNQTTEHPIFATWLAGVLLLQEQSLYTGLGLSVDRLEGIKRPCPYAKWGGSET